MAKLIYSMLTSVDGYTEDEQGDFDGVRKQRASVGR